VNQLQAKRKSSDQAREQIGAIQREIKEMQEQENNSLWEDSPHQDSGPYRGTPKENIFAGNGISQFVDPESPLSIGLQTAPCLQSSNRYLYQNTMVLETLDNSS
jgi:hypothetical protein